MSTAADPHCHHHQHCKHYYHQASLATENASKAQTSSTHYRERAAISTAANLNCHQHQHLQSTANTTTTRQVWPPRMPPEPRDMSRHGRGYRARTAALSGRPPRVAAAVVDTETTVAGATIAEAASLVAAVAVVDAVIAAAGVAAGR